MVSIGFKRNNCLNGAVGNKGDTYPAIQACTVGEQGHVETLGRLLQHSVNQVSYKQQKCNPPSSKGCEMEAYGPGRLWCLPYLAPALCACTHWKGHLLPFSLLGASIPFTRILLFWYKRPFPLNAIISEARVSTHEWQVTDIQVTADDSYLVFPSKEWNTADVQRMSGKVEEFVGHLVGSWWQSGRGWRESKSKDYLDEGIL